MKKYIKTIEDLRLDTANQIHTILTKGDLVRDNHKLNQLQEFLKTLSTL